MINAPSDTAAIVDDENLALLNSDNGLEVSIRAKCIQKIRWNVRDEIVAVRLVSSIDLMGHGSRSDYQRCDGSKVLNPTT